ncbi:uncharacterized protein LOC134513396 isoform X4 [Chroicocephalus ridibundus]|uniref:uncharacterized protein LOC134513396 isoform X4 n=1 Tax=Chroicocephalus ridibundus TaxID=1192867 RepID=UPI002FDDD676
MVLMPLNLPQLSDSSACSPHQSFLPVETECHLPGTISSRPKQGKEKSQTPCILRCTPSRLQRASEKNRCRAGSEKPEVWLCDGLLHTCEQVTSVILLLLQSPHAWYKSLPTRCKVEERCNLDEFTFYLEQRVQIQKPGETSPGTSRPV